MMTKKVNSISIGEGPDVVLVHGVLSSIHCWDHTIPTLVEAGYRCHALDVLGHGESAKPESPEAYNSASIYAHLDQWIDSLELNSPFWLIGHSLGGYLSLRYALEQPGKIKGLTLISPYFTPDQTTYGVRLAMATPELTAAAMPYLPHWAMRVSAWALNNTWGLDKDAQYHLANDQHRAHPHVLFYGIPSIEDLTPQLRYLKTKTTLIWGADDHSLRTQYFSEFLECVPEVEGYEIKGAGHVPQLTEAAFVNEKILELLQ